MIDALGLIRAHLMTNAALAALVGERIYGGRDVPPVGYKPGDGPCITFKIRGGGADYDDALLLPSVQFECYDLSEQKANNAYEALYEALHNSTGANVLYGLVDVLGQTLEEPATGWYFVLSYFTIMLRQ